MPGFIINNTGAIDNTNGPRGNIEVARSNRWIVSIIDADIRFKDITIYAHECGRPTRELEKITMHHGINELYFPGKVKWQPIDLKFYEVIDDNDNPTTASVLYDWWQSTYNLESHAMFSNNVSKLKKQMDIELLDGMGNSIWKYRLSGVWPTKVAPSQLSYKGSDLSEITVSLSYDWADEM